MRDLQPRFATLMAILFGLLLVALDATPAHARGNEKYASLVLDAQTGEIISSRYPDKIVHPASLTKMMTIYMIFRELEAKRLTLDSTLPVSMRAAAQPPSKAGVKAGKTVRVRDAIGLLVTLSANDLAVAIGEKISGSEKQFGQDMTMVARTMGMTKTKFTNASGLPDPQQVTTARDMAILARALLYHYPQYYHFFALKSYSFNGKVYKTHNRLMNTFAGMDGLKTGFINASGFNLVASAKRNDQRLIGVVFGGRSWQSRNSHMAEILNTGFDKLAQSRPLIQEVSYKPGAAMPLPAKAQTVPTPMAPVTAASGGSFGGWSIQIGAYSAQAQTAAVAAHAVQVLQPRFASARAQVVPFTTSNGTLYRARVEGLTQQQAVEACRALPSCLVVQPQANNQANNG